MKKIVTGLLFLFHLALYAQNTFTRLDTLRGSITPEREWWDLVYYHLDIEVKPGSKSLAGSNKVVYRVLKPHNVLQVDLQEPLSISKITQDGVELTFKKEGPAHFVKLEKEQEINAVNEIVVYYEGVPMEAKNPPWDGGLTWEKDSSGNDFIATSCQGLGASVWWPCKDHMYDEVDSMLMSVEVPDHLTDVSNGRLRGVDRNKKKKTKTYHWFVQNPINNYGVNLNIGDYVSWNEQYEGEKGTLDVDYWVLRQNEKIAQKHFKEVITMLEAFEYWFGPYPFYEDGYKLVEAPYLGMEHQSSITYGNGYVKGYRGHDLSETGWGLLFDYIIIHESGHEWFANNITYRDIADMWIHESFTTYSESLFVEYVHGKDAGTEYCRGQRRSIGNKAPMIGPYGVNKRGSDLYSKGANVLNTLRHVIDDDEKWREILRGLNSEFYHKTVRSEDIEDYITKKSGMDLKPFFDLYLRTYAVPVFEYTTMEGKLIFRWTGVHKDFNMPLDIITDQGKLRLNPTTSWGFVDYEGSEVIPDENYYISVMNGF